jgi:LysM repeat protein
VNLLKNLLVVGILLAVAGGVYLALTSSPPTKPPPGADESFAGEPKVEIPGQATGTQSVPQGIATSALGGEAPPFGPKPPAGPATLVAVAPPTRDPGNVLASHNEPLPGDPRNLLPNPPSPLTSPATDPHAAFAGLMAAVDRKLEQGGPAGLLDVHRVLSSLSDHPALTAEESHRLIDTLNRVAGAVIYSREPVMGPLYAVQPGETLPQIAARCRVPWTLLAKINDVRDPEHLQPGQPLKLVQGPFGAVVNLNRHLMTLTLNNRFAGQFHIGLGVQPPAAEGTFQVVACLPGGPTANPAAPQGRRIVLSNQMTIQETPPQQIGRNDGPGTIGLVPRDMDAAFDILLPATADAEGSQVVIQGEHIRPPAEAASRPL